MATLEKKGILKRLKNDLIISPILDMEKQIDSIGIDLRLSNQFLIFKSENISSFDFSTYMEHPDEIRKIQKKVVINFHSPFVLHPGNMILGSTFEYVSMPNDIEGSIEGRSSWARVGLIIATATSIDPGFKGCITLELTNVSNTPLKLYPGTRISQLILRQTTGKSDYESANKKYHLQIGPSFSKANKDSDNLFFMKDKYNKR